MGSNSLERFHVAQDARDSGFAAALAELRTTGKRGHWIWYVFPQLAGLGGSIASQRYGIRDAEEAAEYLRDPVLRSRLIDATRAVADKLHGGVALRDVMGSHVDSLKIVSSLTLFERVAKTSKVDEGVEEYAALADLAAQVLAMAEGQGYPRCAITVGALG